MAAKGQMRSSTLFHGARGGVLASSSDTTVEPMPKVVWAMLPAEYRGRAPGNLMASVRDAETTKRGEVIAQDARSDARAMVGFCS